MERTPGRPIAPSLRAPSMRWRIIGQYLPMAVFGLAVLLIVRNVAGNDAPASPPVTVAADHARVLADDIAFFESRVAETHDSLSYNRLTGYYLQRLRETGDSADVQRAELSANKSLEAAPGDYAGLINLALVKIAEHDFDTAVTLTNQAHALIPTRVDALAILGDAQVALGQYTAAAENYRLYLEKEPGFSAYSREAVIADTNGNVALAEQYWKAAIDSDADLAPENSAWARVQLATLYFNNGRLDDAKAQLDQSLKTYPGYVYAEAGLAQVAAARGDDTTAIALYTKATDAVPQPIFVAALADVYTHAGRDTDAARQAALMGAIRQLFDANGIRNDLTLITFALDHGGDIPATLELARTAYEQRPAIQAADTYAWALYRAGRFDDARAKADEATRLGTADPLILFHAGMIAKAQGDSAAATGFLERAVDLNPNFSVLHAPEAQAALGELKGAK
jgi:tetratricopeptide (TPR) repeat protein